MPETGQANGPRKRRLVVEVRLVDAFVRPGLALAPDTCWTLHGALYAALFARQAVRLPDGAPSLDLLDLPGSHIRGIDSRGSSEARRRHRWHRVTACV